MSQSSRRVAKEDVCAAEQRRSLACNTSIAGGAQKAPQCTEIIAEYKKCREEQAAAARAKRLGGGS